MKQTASEYAEVKESSIHNKGIFAKKDIPKGTSIIEYIGRKIKKNEAETIGEKTLKDSENHTKSGGVYLFELNRKYDLDGNVPYNTAKYINHSCNPNCEAITEDNHVWIIALKDIKEGEELNYNYGYDLEIEDLHEHPCHCKSKNCVGVILAEEFWEKIPTKALNTPV
tara:strand:- start:1958 stop:2461 length:504 start_codon:yes stop_codon:yes gene_type:complete